MFNGLAKVLSEVASTTFQKVRCSFFGKTKEAKVLNIYGISFGVPDNSFGIALRPDGYGDELFIIVDKPDSRFSGLEPWEIKIGNYNKGSYIYFNEDGDILLKPASGRKIILEDDVEVQGDLTLTGDMSAGSISTYVSHTHKGVQPGSGSSGVPN